MTAPYDVIIVGGGHNGLIAGAYLGKAGKRVLVVEQASMAGGLSQSDHVIPEAPDHMINTGDRAGCGHGQAQGQHCETV